MTTLTVDIIIGMLILSGICMAYLGWYGRQFTRRIPAAVPYTLLMFSAAAWAVLYALDLLTGSLQLKIIFHNLRFLILPFFSVLELWLVIAFVKRTEWLKRDWAALVLIIPVAAVILAITSPLHTLFRYNFSIDSSGPLPVLQYAESPFFTVYSLYSLILLILAILILIAGSRKRGTLWMEQTVLLLIALAFPTIINYLFVFGITPVPGVNMAAPLLWIPAILYTVALFRYRFLDVIPIARSRLIETMSTPMLVMDMDCRIIDMNPAACSLFSTTVTSAVGKPINAIASDWPDFLLLCQTDRTNHADLVRDQAGSVRFYTGSVEQIFTLSGEPEGRLVQLQDVTDQKNAEQALRESEEKFSRAFRSSPYAMSITGMSDGLIVDVNEVFEQITGYRSDEFAGKTTLDLNLWVNETDRQSVIEDLQNGRRVTGREFPFQTRNGRILTGLFSAEVIIVRDHPYILSSISDITDQRLAEAERENLIHDLALKNTELDRFTYTVSHDLKSPLITIRGFLGLLEEDLRKNDPIQAQSDINRISSAAENMERLIATLLALSRSGRAIDAPVRISFSALAGEAAGQLETPVREHHVTLNIPENLPVISGDRVRLLQVMTNLLDNAIKFMGDQREPRIDVGVQDDAGTPVFFVQDNGMGIKKENLAKVFGLYERFNPEIPGTGIGLATVKRIIEAHGGKIWAESEGEGMGTTMCFTLPGTVTGKYS
ncbi:MAG: histidine kinase N-terminal 7TM domain-containing protein [Methanoregula sp.]|nr:histidine kinase N-terminal 7TM domain-containing protein [Methanoregula sp.]